MTEKVAVSFSELIGADAAVAGGKAASLARMLQAGYPVPDGFVLLPSAFDGDDLAPGSWAAAENQLNRLRRNGGTSFAVRSSALSEDSARASFAGEFTSRLGVAGAEPLREAIRAVRVSRRSERVRQYSQAQGMDGSHQMAVVVQRMVAPAFSGVLFTADPVSGDRGVMCGNYVRGLGQQLVSGEATGQQFTLRRPIGRYQGPPEIRRYARKLYRLAAGLEEDLGGPQDIEWAVAQGKLYLLQSRAITTLPGHNPMIGEYNDSLLGDYFWSNVNIGEVYMQVLTPFTWSRLQEAYRDTSPLPGYDILGNIGGRPYFNVSVTAAMLLLIGRNVDDITNEFAGGYARVPSRDNFRAVPLPRSAFFTILARGARMQWKHWLALRRHHRILTENPAKCRQFAVRIRAVQRPEELHPLWFGELRGYGMACFWLMGATAQTYGALAGQLRRQLMELLPREEADILLSGVSSDTTLLASLGPVVGLWRLFRGEISRETFLTEFGHRGPDEGEYAQPRPIDDPQWLERQLAAFTRSPVDVGLLLEKQRARFDAAWARFQGQYPRQAPSVKKKLDKAAAAARLREWARSETMRISWVSRVAAVHAGELTGLGDDIFFLNFRELEDLLLGRSTAALQWVPMRRETYQRYSALPAYPTSIRGRFDLAAWMKEPVQRLDYYDERVRESAVPEMGEAARMLKGSPGASGCVQGAVRRLDSPDEAGHLLTGEILVTSHTNIGWTMLFPRAAAIVTDIGAPLSHAAIVARELGIPAVVGCGDATTRLKTGDRVRVDGGRGTVEILAV